LEPTHVKFYHSNIVLYNVVLLILQSSLLIMPFLVTLRLEFIREAMRKL
jgi:hypothetical protein